MILDPLPMKKRAHANAQEEYMQGVVGICDSGKCLAVCSSQKALFLEQLRHLYAGVRGTYLTSHRVRAARRQHEVACKYVRLLLQG
jgi:hypothetical protein